MMNKFKPDERFHMRLYALTSISSVAWLIQSVAESYGEQSFISVPHVILWLCILVAIVYTGYSAYELQQQLKRADSTKNNVASKKEITNTESQP